MSHTLNHMPYWVKQNNPAWRDVFIEDHDHSVSACDIDKHDPNNWQASHCHIDMRNIGRNFNCGCRMCTGHNGRKLARKQERVAWRSLRQVILAEVDRQDVDVPPLQGKAW